MGEPQTAISPSRRRTDAESELDRLLTAGLIEPVYQPIVHLKSRQAVAFEALARGPKGSILEMPAALFGAASRHGKLEVLDWACRSAAIRGAFDAELLPPAALFVNVEPVAAGQRVPQQYAALAEEARDGLRVVFEFTERALTDFPGEVLYAVRALRKLGAMIALDDVGIDPRSLALLPFLEPEVVKLDMSLTHDPHSRHSLETAMAVQAYAESSGAIVLAEGIEDEQHLLAAAAMGATHGQGWLFGRPGPLPKSDAWQAVDAFSVASQAPADLPVTPYAWFSEAHTPQGRVDSSGMRALWSTLLRRAATMEAATVVLASQSFWNPSDPTLEMLGDLAGTAAFAGLLTFPSNRAPRALRRGKLYPHEPMAREVCLCILGPHQSVCLAARRDSTDPATLDYVISHDRPAVSTVARQLMTRIEPERT